MARRWWTVAGRRDRTGRRYLSQQRGVRREPAGRADRDTGERLWTRDVGAAVRLAAADSTLYVATRDRVLALRE
ncbi:PQQ-binding-like beta-propeller repeat protein [Halobacteriaceae archaeon GCM10025711]